MGSYVVFLVLSGTVYHPPSADDRAILDYLITSLTAIEGLHPSCGVLLAGDFNRLNVNRLWVQFNVKQLVLVPTRAERIFDLIITNIPQFYGKDTLVMYPPFGLSDHSVVVLHAKEWLPNTPGQRTVTKRDTRPSRKNELGRYLSAIHWSIVESAVSSEDKLRLLIDFIKVGLDTIIPFQQVKLHNNDPPWITAAFKNLIKLRQKAFSKGDTQLYRYYRNPVNRERKLCRSKLFFSKILQLKETKPKLVERDQAYLRYGTCYRFGPFAGTIPH